MPGWHLRHRGRPNVVLWEPGPALVGARETRRATCSALSLVASPETSVREVREDPRTTGQLIRGALGTSRFVERQQGLGLLGFETSDGPSLTSARPYADNGMRVSTISTPERLASLDSFAPRRCRFAQSCLVPEFS